jgi:hypothetical protein
MSNCTPVKNWDLFSNLEKVGYPQRENIAQRNVKAIVSYYSKVNSQEVLSEASSEKIGAF